MVQAIIWDNDGVLVDTEKYYYHATRGVLASVGVELSEDLYRDLLLRQSKGAWHLAVEKGLPPTQVEALRADRNRRYLQMLQTEEIWIEGVEETLNALAQRFSMGIVTSSHRDHFEAIHRRTGYLKYFDLILTREDTTHAKPHPEPYLLGCRLLGIDPGKALAVEDSERGLTAAKAAGLTCWVIPNGLTASADFSSADRVLASVCDVRALLVQG